MVEADARGNATVARLRPLPLACSALGRVFKIHGLLAKCSLWNRLFFFFPPGTMDSFTETKHK